MYTVLVQNDNSIIVTERQRIMQNSKLIDVLQIIVPKLYNGLEMVNYNVRLEYLTPINHKHGYVEMEVADSDYKTDYLLYTMKIDTNLTTEVGDVQFTMTFIEVSMTDDGTVETPVRKTDVFVMPVIPIANWFSAPDSALSALDQRIIANQEAIKAMADLQADLIESKLDDITLDTTAKKVYGTAGGIQKGIGIDINALGDAIADNTVDGLVLMNTFINEEDD